MEKGTLKKWPKKKRSQFGPGYNPKVVSARPPPPNAEIKWYDQTGVSTFNNASSSVPVHAAVGSLNLISQGDQGDNRNGQKIMVRSIDLRGTVEVAKHSGSDFDDLKCETHYFRWILMIDTQANGAFPNLTDVFEENPTGGDQFDIYNSLRETGRYKILMDKVLRINELTPGWNTQTNRWHAASRLQYFQKHVNLDLPIQFSDQYGNLASVRNNNICMIILSGANSNTQMTYNYRSRIRFSDY